MAFANWSRSNLSAALFSSARKVGSSSTVNVAPATRVPVASSSFARARLAITASLLRNLRSPDLSPASGNSTLPGPDDRPPCRRHLPFGMASCPQGCPVRLARAEQSWRKCPLYFGFSLYLSCLLSWQEADAINPLLWASERLSSLLL